MHIETAVSVVFYVNPYTSSVLKSGYATVLVSNIGAHQLSRKLGWTYPVWRLSSFGELALLPGIGNEFNHSYI